jgi:hypothetical protein
MLLHRPHSRLLYSNIETQSKCTPPPSARQTRAMQKSIAVHTAKALEAIEATIILFTLPSPYLKHSPIVTCALALAIMAQVSACNHVLDGPAFKLGRERIRLGLGALKAQVNYWGLAKRSVREVVGVARELLSIPTLSGSASGSKTVGPRSGRSSHAAESIFDEGYLQTTNEINGEHLSQCTKTGTWDS